MANKPVLSKRAGMLRVAVWDNERESKKDGKKYMIRSFSLTKAWPGQDGEYVERKLPINKSDLTDLAVLVRYMEENYHIPKPEVVANV